MEVKDFVAEQRDVYMPTAKPEIIDVPEMLFLMVDGKGLPDMNISGGEFQQAFSALYGLVYSIKMSPKKSDAPAGYFNFKVPPPEGLWWTAKGADYGGNKPEDWRWTLMIRVPAEFVTDDVVKYFTDKLVAKKKSDVYQRARLEPYHEGLCVQLMHIGSYDSEAPDIARLHDFAVARGYRPLGKHHEIYYGDPRRTAPERLHTVLRQPITKGKP